jgi:hypothetical protein
MALGINLLKRHSARHAVFSVSNKNHPRKRFLAWVSSKQIRRIGGCFCAHLGERVKHAKTYCVGRKMGEHIRVFFCFHPSNIRSVSLRGKNRPQQNGNEIHKNKPKQKPSVLCSRFCFSRSFREKRFFQILFPLPGRRPPRNQPTLFWFSDLSAAGLPAELKHIIQRRKRKQP